MTSDLYSQFTIMLTMAGNADALVEKLTWDSVSYPYEFTCNRVPGFTFGGG